MIHGMGRVLIVGLAKSGVAAANLLATQGRKVTATDIRAEVELEEFTRLLLPDVDVVAGGHPDYLFEDAELVVVSPGVPLGIEPLSKAREAGVEIIGEMELAWRAVEDIPVYAVTGTNGKSTTVTLLDLMMKESGRRSFLGGNIGTPITEELANKANGRLHTEDIDCIVAEVSSFQLESIVNFRPHVASVLNITPDHMDRYASMEEYRLAKGRIFLNQTERDFLVLNADDPETMKLYDSARKLYVQVSFFSREREVEGIFLKGETVIYGGEPFIESSEIGIMGVHNLENAMAASLMALLAGCEPKDVRAVLKSFKGLEHRCEFVREINGVRFVNDSKGTNVGAVIKSIEGFRKEPLILIAGGRDKNGDFKKLAEAVRGRLKKAVLIGEASQKMRKALDKIVECVYASDLSDAVRKSFEAASSGDVVLLSPACASFDMFRNFEHRGEEFKRLVREL
jgi:UDP-N-acetylmuramoylalanine--D-glutamate ligase